MYVYVFWFRFCFLAWTDEQKERKIFFHRLSSLMLAFWNDFESSSELKKHANFLCDGRSDFISWTGQNTISSSKFSISVSSLKIDEMGTRTRICIIFNNYKLITAFWIELLGHYAMDPKWTFIVTSVAMLLNNST